MIKIESKKHAVVVINHVSKVLILIGILQIFFTLGILKSYSVIGIINCILGVIFIVLALFLRKFKSSLIAIFTLILSSVLLVFSSMDAISSISKGNAKMFPVMGVAFVIASIQALKATLRYNKDN